MLSIIGLVARKDFEGSYDFPSNWPLALEQIAKKAILPLDSRHSAKYY